MIMTLQIISDDVIQSKKKIFEVSLFKDIKISVKVVVIDESSKGI